MAPVLGGVLKLRTPRKIALETVQLEISLTIRVRVQAAIWESTSYKPPL